ADRGLAPVPQDFQDVQLRIGDGQRAFGHRRASRNESSRVESGSPPVPSRYRLRGEPAMVGDLADEESARIRDILRQVSHGVNPLTSDIRQKTPGGRDSGELLYNRGRSPKTGRRPPVGRDQLRRNRGDVAPRVA